MCKMTGARRVARGLCAMTLTLAVSNVTFAQAAKPGARTSAPRPPQSSANERAFTLYEQGRAAFKEGRYSEAVVMLLESQRLEPVPVLDFNIAKAYEALGETAKAIEHYRTFLKNAGDIPDRAEIEAKVAELEASLTPVAPDPPAPIAPTPAKPIEPEAPGPNVLPWIVAGVGLVGIGVGAGVGAAASSTNDDVASAPNQVEGAALRSSAEDLALGANLAFGIGGAVLAGGVIWGIVDLTTGAPGDADEKPAVTARVGPTWAELTVAF